MQANAASASTIETVPSVCPHDCTSTCALEVERIDAHTIGRVRGSSRNSYTAGVICEKVARYAQRIHHPDRLTRPLRRVGPKGSRQFAPISWHDALDIVADSGFDIVNPVQWCAGGHTPAQWKTRTAARRLALWGGGVDSQHTLPLGTVADVERQVRKVAPLLSAGGGYVFCNIHNILAEIAPEKVMAMYREAKATSRGVVGLPQGCVVR